MKIKKVVMIMIFIFIFLIIYLMNNKMIKYDKQINFFDNKITITIYSKNKKQAENIIKDIKNIYKEYKDIKNKLYNIRHNFNQDELLKIDKELYNIINIGINLYDLSNHTIDISKGNIIELINNYPNNIPSSYEFSLANNQNISDIILKNDEFILNNHININIDDYLEEYVLIKIKDYLNKKRVKYFSISSENNIFVGNHIKKNFSIAVSISEDKYEIIKANNCFINIEKNAFNFEELNYFDNYKNIIVITKDSKKALYLSKLLYKMDIKEGLNYINNLSDTEALWYTVNNEIIKSEGFNKYN